MTYEEMMNRVRECKDSKGSIPTISHHWNFLEPYKMICMEYEEEKNSKVIITFAFKPNDKIITKKFSFYTSGKASYFWEEFLSKAFPDTEDLTWNMILGRPFVAEIVKNEKFDNLHVLSGYKGNFPEEPEGLE